ncbi:MAG: sulfopyruvate decarboxylase subunit beta [Spirochaetes bacterium]|nr:sulfopyruvate decarboxylase subunit beta [Spirochaetota bacterium]
MNRFNAFNEIMGVVANELVVCNIGHPSQELFNIRDRAENFYMLGSMGMASSIGLGLALSTERTVIALDGDGSVLMNLGTLATIGSTKPSNFILVIIDNGAYGSTGFQKTFTSVGVDLAGIACSCGIANTVVVDDRKAVGKMLARALAEGDGPYCVIIRVSKDFDPALSPLPLGPLEIKERFMKSIGTLV